MKNKIILAVAGILISASLFAGDTFRIQVGGDFITNQSTQMSYGYKGASVSLDIEDFFKMNTDNTVLRLDGYYRFNDAHRIEFAYYKIDSSGSASAQKDFEWDGGHISAGSNVNSHFNVDMYKVNYTYSFYHTDEVELGLSAGLHITGLDVGLAVNGVVNGNPTNAYSSRFKVTAPLPVLGARFRYNISKDLEVNFSYDLFMLKIGDYKGDIQNTIFTLDYALTEHFGVGAGFDLYSLSFESDKDNEQFKATRDVNGGLVYFSYRY